MMTILACYPHVTTEFATDSARRTTQIVDAVTTKVSAVVASAPICSASGTGYVVAVVVIVLNKNFVVPLYHFEKTC